MKDNRLKKIRKFASAVGTESANPKTATSQAPEKVEAVHHSELIRSAKLVIVEDDSADEVPAPVSVQEPVPASAPQVEEPRAALKPRKQFKKTIVFPTSIIQSIQTNELQLVLISQMARVFSLFRVSNIIILEDNTYSSNPSFSPSEFLLKVLSYLETPQYLRKKLFPISSLLRNIGYATPLECSHHLKETEESEYREGVVERRPVKETAGSWVDIGLGKSCRLDCKLEENTRVTVKIEDFMFHNKKCLLISLQRRRC
mgnify:FL=1